MVVEFGGMMSSGTSSNMATWLTDDAEDAEDAAAEDERSLGVAVPGRASFSLFLVVVPMLAYSKTMDRAVVNRLGCGTNMDSKLAKNVWEMRVSGTT